MLCYLFAPRPRVVGPLFCLVMLTASPARAQEAPAASSSSPGPAVPDGEPSLVPHTLAGRADCLSCHGPAGAHPFPVDHARRSNKTCTACHISTRSTGGGARDKRTSPHVTNNYCLACHGTPTAAMVLPDGERLSLFIDQAEYEHSTHGRSHMPCTACHTAQTEYPHPPVTAKTRRELSRGIVQQSCFSCHEKVFEQFKESVHGKALVEAGNVDVPGCPDCHGIHDIAAPHTPLFRLESPDTCSKCHADPKLAEKYGMSAHVTESYLNDFHGATIRLARQEDPDIASYKAVCYDCHGIHDIRKVEDPASHVVAEQLVETCRRCHPGADASFPAAWTSHYEPDRERWPIVYWVNFAYKILIPGVLGPMILYILLDLVRAVINRMKGAKHG